jgi:hypothetical protein
MQYPEEHGFAVVVPAGVVVVVVVGIKHDEEQEDRVRYGPVK